MLEFLEDLKWDIEMKLKERKRRKQECKEIHNYIQKLGVNKINEVLIPRSFELKNIRDFRSRWRVDYEGDLFMEIIGLINGNCRASMNDDREEEAYQILKQIEDIVINELSSEYHEVLAKETREELERTLSERAEKEMRNKRLKKNLEI